MAGTTTRAVLPYPTGGDLVRDGDNAIQQLAERLDGSSGAQASVPWAMAGGTLNTAALNADAGVQGAVTFPASRFTVAPLVAVSHDSTGYTLGAAAGVTATGFTGRAYNPTSTATTGTGILRWLAVQMTSAAAGG